jgi:hypothetical protein
MPAKNALHGEYCLNAPLSEQGALSELSSGMNKRQRGPMQDELTDAMHGEFTVDAETDRQHRLDTARSTVRAGLFTAARAAEAYGFSVEEVTTSDLGSAN